MSFTRPILFSIAMLSTSLAFAETAILRAPGPEGAVLLDLPGMRRAPGPEGVLLPDLPGMRRAPGPEGAVLTDLPGMRRALGPSDTVLSDFPGMRRAPGGIPIRVRRLRMQWRSCRAEKQQAFRTVRTIVTLRLCALYTPLNGDCFSQSARRLRLSGGRAMYAQFFRDFRRQRTTNRPRSWHRLLLGSSSHAG
jgi:hypothetical protein